MSDADAINPFSPVRTKAPVRTYGRRQKTPESQDDGPSLFRPTETAAVGSTTNPSPGRLLNRWTKSSLGFLGGLDGIGREPQPEKEASAVATDEEAIELLKKMRRKGGPMIPSSDDTSETAGQKSVVAGSTRPSTTTLAVKQVLHRSSSLTELPSSSLPSSPPSRVIEQPPSPSRPPARPAMLLPTESVEEETLPVRAPGHQRGKRAMIPVDEEEETEERSRTPLASSPPTPSAAPRRSRRASTRSATPDSPIIGSRRQKSQRAKRIQSYTPDAANTAEEGNADSASDADEGDKADEDEARSLDTETGKPKYMPSASVKDAFFEDLAAQSEDDEADDVEKITGADKSDRNEDSEEPKTSKPRKERALNKKDRLQVQKDIAAAQRGRFYEPTRPLANQMPLTSFMVDAALVVTKRDPEEHNLRIPGLSHGPSSPASSMYHRTPPDDPIEPYSSPRDQQLPGKKVARFAMPQVGADKNRRTTLPAAAATLKLSTVNKRTIDPQVMAKWEEAKARAESAPRSSDVIEDDDDLEIEPPAPTPAATVAAQKKKGPDAKRVLEWVSKGDKKQLSKAEQANLARAGRSTRVNNAILTETYAAHAGKAFGHHNERHANGGAKPAGQKRGRDQQIDTATYLSSLANKHMADVHRVRTEKEALYGKGRIMPERQELDMEKMQEDAKRRQDLLEQGMDGGEDEDEDDDDYVGSGDEEGSGSDVDGGEDKENEEPYSGEERDDEEVEGDEQEDGDRTEEERDEDVLIAATSSGPALDVALEERSDSITETQEDEMETPVRTRRKPRPSKTVIMSDDEDGPANTSTRSPLAEINVQTRSPLLDTPTGPSTAHKDGSTGGLAPAAAFGFGDFDAGGFGDDAGFSQLFDATQLNTATNGEAGPSKGGDGFAALRATPKGFFAAHAALPENVISDTQKERDLALVAGDGDDVPIEEEQPKQRYLNEAGLFTQTKPASLDTSSLSNRGLLAGRSTDSIFGIGAISEEASPARELSPSRTGTSPREPSPSRYDTPGQPRIATPPRTSSPKSAREEEDSDGEAPMRRLRRRASTPLAADPDDGEEADADESDTEEDISPDQPSPTQVSDARPTQNAAPTQPQRNAFQMLMAKKRDEMRGPAPEDKLSKRKNGRSELVDEQAEESDEDAGWGPTERGPDDDEEGAEEDGFLEDLVDDVAVDEATKKEQDRLAEQKMREIEKADDEKRQAEAQKIADGQSRVKQRGRDFYSEDEDDGRVKRKKLSKDTRRRMKQMDVNGVALFGHEDTTSFQKCYQDDSSDDEDDDIGLDDVRPVQYEDESLRPQLDVPIARRDRSKRSPEPESLQPLPDNRTMSWKERHEMLRALAQANEEDPEIRESRLDAEIGELPDEYESQFSITSKRRPFDGVGPFNTRKTSLRSTESLQKWVADEATLNRPAGGFGPGVSVINRTGSIPRPESNKFGGFQNGRAGAGGKGGNSKGGRAPARGGTGILGSKNTSFAS